MGPFPPEREEDFAPLFPQEVLRRGLAYAREGRVLRVYRAVSYTHLTLPTNREV